MSIFPKSMEKAGEPQETKKEKQGFRDICFDLKTKKVKVIDGRVAFATKKEQLQQWIFFLIMTEMGKYRVHDDTEFGIVFLYKMRGMEFYSSGFTVTQIREELRRKLLQHELVEEVRAIDIDIKFNKMIIRTTLVVDGEEIESEVESE